MQIQTRLVLVWWANPDIVHTLVAIMLAGPIYHCCTCMYLLVEEWSCVDLIILSLLSQAQPPYMFKLLGLECQYTHMRTRVHSPWQGPMKQQGQWTRGPTILWHPCPSVGRPPGHYSLGNFVPPDIIYWRILSPRTLFTGENVPPQWIMSPFLS